jgi:hypothetical protein
VGRQHQYHTTDEFGRLKYFQAVRQHGHPAKVGEHFVGALHAGASATSNDNDPHLHG